MVFRSIFLILVTTTICGCGADISKTDKRELESKHAKDALESVQQGKTAEAIVLYEKELREQPDAARVHLELAMLLHESEKDYIGALYHYRKYLRLRPDTEKKQLIEKRMKAARQMIAAGVAGTEDLVEARTADLEAESLRLRKRIRQLEESLSKARAVARKGIAVRTASEDVPDVNAGAALTHEGGLSRYTVQKGDSLSIIANKVYKDGSQWEQIYEANRRELENSNELKVGQILIIP
jgi:tetratricopeptide (TPR) repeat protein